jgi:phosphate transport system substrate-binding protein
VRVETSAGAASEIGAGQAVQSGTLSSRRLTLAGSNTIGASLAPRLAELFADQIEGDLIEWRIDGPNSRTALFEGGGPGSLQAIAIEAHGSSTGFRALADGTADLALASRPIKPEEAVALADQGDMLSPNAEHVLGLDGIAVIVHPGNPLISLTTEQIRAIFNGEIGNWSQLTLPGIVLPDAPIEVLARDAQSGTFDTFANLILGDPMALRPDAERFTSDLELADQIAIRPNAIGFAGLGHIRNSRALMIDECGIMLPARPFAIKSEEYPLARRLYLYRPPASANPWSGPLIELAGSDAGQTLIAQEGFINLDIASQDEETAAAYATRLDRFQAQIPATLETIRKVTNGAERLTTTFRFRTASARLDARALRDLRRLAAYIRNADIDPARVILAGFADGRGGYDGNMTLSQARAQAVAGALAAEGLAVGEVHGFSEEMPVACDTDERGWQLNRRVEVWLKP